MSWILGVLQHTFDLCRCHPCPLILIILIATLVLSYTDHCINRLGQKCVHRAKEETEGVQKGGEKSEKSENEKDRSRKDALSSA